MLIACVRGVLGVALLMAASGGGAAAGSLTVDKLRCEYKTDPIGIDAARPRLSWVLAAADPRSAA